MIMFYFTTRVGTERKQIPFPADPSLIFADILEEACKKFGLSTASLSFSTPAGLVLTSTDLNKLVSDIVKEFGTAFDIIDQGIVG